jgi:transcriptional regulator with XRE-family HTH domain
MRVMANVEKLRRSNKLTYKELSGRLERLGRPIPVLGLSRLERGERRVDVDDLVALALALDTTPNRLLLPWLDAADVADDGTLTLAVSRDPQELWAWATGERALGRPAASAAATREFRGDEVVFNRTNQPHHWRAASWHEPSSSLQDLVEDSRTADAHPNALLVGLVTTMVLYGFKAGMTTAVIRDAVQAAITAALLMAHPDDMDIRLTEANGGISLHVSDRTAASAPDGSATGSES